MPPRYGSEDAQSVRDILHTAFPLQPNDGGFVTHLELNAAILHVETKIVNAELKLQKWVLVGCLSVIVAFGGGYIWLVGKLDRLTETLPVVTQVLDGRRSWMLHQDQRDDQQDRVLQQIDKEYSPPPYVEPPK